MNEKPYTTLSSRIIHENGWYKLREDAIRLPDGSEGTYTIVDRPGAVWIVPIVDGGQMVLIRNYRYTIDRWMWEVPAGSIESADDPMEDARRELLEEVGGTAAQIKQITEMYTMPGISNAKGRIFLATGVKLGEPKHEPTEVMERHIFPVDEVVAMVHRGDVLDGPSALAILLSLPHLRW